MYWPRSKRESCLSISERLLVWLWKPTQIWCLSANGAACVASACGHRCLRSFSPMPHLFRTPDNRIWKASHPIPLWKADGAQVMGIWGGSAQSEKLAWWLKKPGHELTQSDVVSAVAVRDDETQEIRWGEVPQGVRLLFVLEPPLVGKCGENYRIAKMVTTAATPAQTAYFRDERFALLGSLRLDGTVDVTEPLAAPKPEHPAQGELF